MSIVVVNDVGFIGVEAFRDCTNLTSVTYKGTVYTNKAELEKALSDNNVTVGNDFENNVFANTGLQ